MAYSRSMFSLFFSLPLDATDYSNLEASQIRRVMLPFRIACQYPHMLSALTERGVRLILRIDEAEMQSYYPTQYKAELEGCKRLAHVEAVILGNEPEAGVNLTYASRDWGIVGGRARQHAAKVSVLRTALSGMGVALVSPGWTAGRLHEVDTLQPGRQAWRIECGEAYSKCDGAGGHVYLHEWRGWTDEFRFLYQVTELCEMFHRPVWLDEVGVTAGTDLEQMQAYIRMSRMLEDTGWPAHDRVAAFIPFCSNGDGIGWNPKYLLRDPKCYELLGEYIAGKGV